MKAAIRVEATLDRLKDAKITPDQALAELASIGEPAILPLTAALQKRGDYAQNTILLALHKIGGDEKVAIAINSFLEYCSGTYYDQFGETKADNPTRDISFDRVALPSLLRELAGKHYEIATPIIVNMGAGKEAIQALLNLARTGKNRTQLMERMLNLQACMSEKGMNFSSSAQLDIDFSGIALEKSLRAPKSRRAFIVPAGKPPLAAKKVQRI